MAETDVRYFRVSPRFWSSAERKGWDDDTRLLALYLLTCPHRTVEGLFRLPKKYVQADLEWSAQRLAEPFARLSADGFLDYDEESQVVLLPSALKYQAPANGNMVKAALKRLAELPETRLTGDFRRLAERFSERLHEALPEGFGKPTGNPQALALTQAPSSGESCPPGHADQPDQPPEPDEAADTFEHFWSIYPARNGKKRGRGNALIEWRKLSIEQRRRAYVGARNLAASDEMPKDAERFLRRSKGGKGDFPFDDWQEPADNVAHLPYGAPSTLGDFDADGTRKGVL